ncbi:MAG: hypothetical protein Q8P20_08235 [bacterium]|nr:hypothetical protein [bacterium]
MNNKKTNTKNKDDREEIKDNLADILKSLLLLSKIKQEDKNKSN